MKSFEYAKYKNDKKSFSVPSIKWKDNTIPFYVLPIAPFIIMNDKFKNWSYDRLKWSEEKAKTVLNYFLPYELEYIEEDKCYYFDTGWDYTAKNRIASRVPFYLKKWTRKFRYEILHYLEDKYENSEFTKTFIKDFFGNTVIKFEKRVDKSILL